jgi:4-diphosphocytidyl-2-C-methyl-D-erythritol kinase
MKLKAPAKINLFLEVINRRPDGYHNIETIFQTVSLFDEIEIKPLKEKLILECSDPSIPNDERNLALKAAIALKKFLKTDLGAKIVLKKNIPSGAGLGGGSSDAACVIKGLLKLWKKRVTIKKLVLLAGKLGADVPFFLFGGTAYASGIGEKLKIIKNAQRSWFVLVNPRISIATKGVYQNLSFPLTNRQKINRIKPLLSSRSMPKSWRHNIFNRLEEPVLPSYPEVLKVKNTLKNMGVISLMSGSGSTVFGVVDSKEEGKAVKSRLKKFPWDTWVVASVS